MSRYPPDHCAVRGESIGYFSPVSTPSTSPVIVAGDFLDGGGLGAAPAYGAAGIGMGTRFLLAQESRVPDAVKQRYLDASLTDTVVTAKVESSSRARRVVPTIKSTLEFKRMSGMTWRQLMSNGRAMKNAQGRTFGQLAMAANTPMMLKAGLVASDPTAGVLASGQVVGLIEDLPSCEDLVDRLATKGAATLDQVPNILIKRD